MKQIPKNSKLEHEYERKKPSANQPNFLLMNPCWRIANLDFDGEWGLLSLLENFKFSYTKELYNAIYERSYEQLNKTLEDLNNKEFETIDKFWNKFKSLYGNDIPIDIVEIINGTLGRYAFFKNVYKKLQEFEKMTWSEISQCIHGKEGKSKNHYISIADLSIKAKNKLVEMGFSDNDIVYSLRLDGVIRIFGFRNQNCMDIIWVDLHHEVCPSNIQKKN